MDNSRTAFIPFPLLPKCCLSYVDFCKSMFADISAMFYVLLNRGLSSLLIFDYWWNRYSCQYLLNRNGIYISPVLRHFLFGISDFVYTFVCVWVGVFFAFVCILVIIPLHVAIICYWNAGYYPQKFAFVLLREFSIRYGMLRLCALLELVFGLFYFAYGGDLLKWVIFSTNFELFYVELITIYSCIA